MSDLHIELCEHIMAIHGCTFDEAADMLELASDCLQLIGQLDETMIKCGYKEV